MLIIRKKSSWSHIVRFPINCQVTEVCPWRRFFKESDNLFHNRNFVVQTGRKSMKPYVRTEWLYRGGQQTFQNMSELSYPRYSSSVFTIPWHIAFTLGTESIVSVTEFPLNVAVAMFSTLWEYFSGSGMFYTGWLLSYNPVLGTLITSYIIGLGPFRWNVPNIRFSFKNHPLNILISSLVGISRPQ
jgi:hypothetical protein